MNILAEKLKALGYEKLSAFSERHAAGLVAVVVVGSAAIALLTTPHIGFGKGQLGLGYGHDGVFYGWMTEHFARFEHPVLGWHFAYRPRVWPWAGDSVLSARCGRPASA